MYDISFSTNSLCGVGGLSTQRETASTNDAARQTRLSDEGDTRRTDPGYFPGISGQKGRSVRPGEK